MLLQIKHSFAKNLSKFSKFPILTISVHGVTLGFLIFFFFFLEIFLDFLSWRWGAEGFAVEVDSDEEEEEIHSNIEEKIPILSWCLFSALVWRIKDTLHID